MALSRRAVIAGAGALAALPQALPQALPLALPQAAADATGLARDERFWAGVAAQFRVSGDFVNLENGYYGIMPEPVRRAYHRNVDVLNARNSHLLRTAYKARADEVRDRIAALLGVTRAEIALTRGGTEALQNLISGYRRLRPGDAVLYADLDYPSAQHTMNWLAGRREATVARFVLPEPATRQAALDAYERALRTTPRARLLLLSHMNNRTGLVLPVREIVAMARERGVDVVVDAAHSWGQLDFTLPALDADFAAFSLHKWIGAPLGTGFLYIRRDRLADIEPVFGDESFPAGDIRSRVHSGTMDVAAPLTVPDALDFHLRLGAAVKQARLRHLRDRWVSQVRDLPGLQILTPDEPGMYGAITAFRIAGRTSTADNEAVAATLLDTYGLYTVARTGMAGGDAVRVTPALFTSAAQVDRLAAALQRLTPRLRA
ncbi:aminotransferase class V-fold PLP-dependent enzyme [Nonomuraea sp. NPDC049655]|uniref:aminotransferase class V-fold PLP-dependent enzyme n=1 Tax=Nonomuraea sp. NPDC049655 TaxID=3364355 RepID=UPI00379C8043